MIFSWLFTGKSSKSLGEKPLDGVFSPYASMAPVMMRCTQHYHHMFWLPLFPLKKEYSLYCSKTNRTIDIESLNETAIDSYQTTKASFKTPFYYYIGPAYLVIFLIFVAFFIQDMRKQNDEYFKEPRAGDIFVMNYPGSFCVFYRVTKVTEASIEALPSKNEYLLCASKKTRDKKYEADFYSNDSVTIPRKLLREIKEKGNLFAIYR